VLLGVASAVAPVVARADGVRADSAGTEKSPQDSSKSDGVDTARAHFQKGVEYYRDGDFRAALIEFERAYSLQPTYKLLYNLAQVTYELRDYAATERYFRTYLVEGAEEISADRRAEVEVELLRLRGRVASVRLHTDQPGAQISIDERPVGTSPIDRPLRLSAGRRRVSAEAPGYAPISRVIDVIGGEEVTVKLDFGPRLSAVSAGQVEGTRSTTYAVWTGVATGALAVGAGVVGYVASRDARDYDDALKRRTSRDELDSLSRQATREAIVTDVLLGAAVVTGAVTVVLLLSGGHKSEESHRAHASGPDLLRGTF
jgi:tetratricopeptide (TPR) repeat protein